jgi:hypothetical protein
LTFVNVQTCPVFPGRQFPEAVLEPLNAVFEVAVILHDASWRNYLLATP